MVGNTLTGPIILNILLINIFWNLKLIDTHDMLP